VKILWKATQAAGTRPWLRRARKISRRVSPLCVRRTQLFIHSYLYSTQLSRKADRLASKGTYILRHTSTTAWSCESKTEGVMRLGRLSPVGEAMLWAGEQLGHCWYHISCLPPNSSVLIVTKGQ
jgi:hypothetical protein